MRQVVKEIAFHVWSFSVFVSLFFVEIFAPDEHSESQLRSALFCLRLLEMAVLLGMLTFALYWIRCSSQPEAQLDPERAVWMHVILSIISVVLCILRQVKDPILWVRVCWLFGTVFLVMFLGGACCLFEGDVVVHVDVPMPVRPIPNFHQAYLVQPALDRVATAKGSQLEVQVRPSVSMSRDESISMASEASELSAEERV